MQHRVNTPLHMWHTHAYNLHSCVWPEDDSTSFIWRVLVMQLWQEWPAQIFHRSSLKECLDGSKNEGLLFEISPMIINASWQSSRWVYYSYCVFGILWLFFHRDDTYADNHPWSCCHLLCLILSIKQQMPRSCSSDSEMITGAAELLWRQNRLWSEAPLKQYI